MARSEPQDQEQQAQQGLTLPASSEGGAQNWLLGASAKRFHEIKRFSLAGVVNTIIGTSLIFLFQTVTAKPYLANTLGYLIAGISAYFLHAKYTFRATTGTRSLSLFAIIAASGYVLNLIILQQALRVTGPLMAQTAAIVGYAAYSYLLQSRFAFPANTRNASQPKSINS